MDSTKKSLFRFIMMNARWARIYKFIKNNGYEEKQTPARVKAALRYLNDTDTAIMAALICHRFYLGKDPFSIRKLAIAMDNSSPDAKKAMEMKIKRYLEAIDHFGIIKFYKDLEPGTKRNCYVIEPSPVLLKFFEIDFFEDTS